MCGCTELSFYSCVSAPLVLYMYYIVGVESERTTHTTIGGLFPCAKQWRYHNKINESMTAPPGWTWKQSYHSSNYNDGKRTIVWLLFDFDPPVPGRSTIPQ